MSTNKSGFIIICKFTSANSSKFEKISAGDYLKVISDHACYVKLTDYVLSIEAFTSVLQVSV